MKPGSCFEVSQVRTTNTQLFAERHSQPCDPLNVPLPR